MKGRRRCPRCREWKELQEFPRNRATKNGLATYCKPCHNYVCAENRKKHHGSARAFHLKRRYEVDEVQVEWMRLRQGGRCAICSTGPAVHVDHEHETGRVRGILCFNCNRALGELGEDVELLTRAVEYLEKATA